MDIFLHVEKKRNSCLSFAHSSPFCTQDSNVNQEMMIIPSQSQNVLIISSSPFVSFRVTHSQLKTCPLDSSGFDFLRANSAGRRDEQCSRDCAMSPIVHLSSGRACSSSVNGPCLVRVSSSTLAQEESSTATKGVKKGKSTRKRIQYFGLEVFK